MGPETEDMWLAVSSWKDPNQIYSRSERAKGTYSQEMAGCEGHNFIEQRCKQGEKIHFCFLVSQSSEFQGGLSRKPERLCSLLNRCVFTGPALSPIYTHTHTPTHSPFCWHSYCMLIIVLKDRSEIPL